MDYSLALAKDLIRYITADKKHKQICVLIAQERFINSGLNFVGVTEIRPLPKETMDLIRQYVYASRDYETDNYVYGHFHMKDRVENWNGGLIWNENLSMVDRWKENSLGLPLNTELIPPIIEPPADYQEQRLHEAYTLDRERTIILAPYANSNANLVESVWEKLVSELAKKNKDYVFYTNVAAPHEKVIPGTAPIITDFSELMYTADKVKCFIGLRSGIFDLLAFTNARLYIINTFTMWYYDLRLNYNHNNSKEFYIASAPEQLLLQAFMKQNNLSSIDNVIFYGRLLGKDIALNTDSLLERIINEVD